LRFNASAVCNRSAVRMTAASYSRVSAFMTSVSPHAVAARLGDKHRRLAESARVDSGGGRAVARTMSVQGRVPSRVDSCRISGWSMLVAESSGDCVVRDRRHERADARIRGGGHPTALRVTHGRRIEAATGSVSGATRLPQIQELGLED